MYKVNTAGYASLLLTCFASMTPLCVYGPPGIGKTEIPRQVFKKKAAEMDRKFVEWSNLTLKEKMALIDDPSGYFVFCDQRIGQMDSTDLRGIPNMTTPEMLETMPPAWVVFFSHPEAHGAIFFDEINLAPPVVAGQAYQIINERTISDRRISDHVFMMAAGNRAEDKAFTFDMPFPLKDRFAECEVGIDVDSWKVWAMENGVNPHLVAFISWKEGMLFKLDESGNDKSSTPRGIVRASKLLGNSDITSSDAHMKVSVAVGEAFATQFKAYCTCYAALDWNKIYNNPETVKGMKADTLFAVVGGLAERFHKALKSEKDYLKESCAEMKRICNILPHMHADFVIIALRMMREGSSDRFKETVRKTPEFLSIARNYGKFIM